jgi:excisionase family DNA binding protein
MTLLTVKQVAAALQLSASKVYELLAKGTLPRYKIGGAVRIAQADLDEYLRGCRDERRPARRVKPLSLRYLSV